MELTLVKAQPLRSVYVRADVNAFEAMIDHSIREKYPDNKFHTSESAKKVEQFILQNGEAKGFEAREKEILWNMELNTFQIRHEVAKNWVFFLTAQAFAHAQKVAADHLQLVNRWSGRKVIVLIADHGVRGHGAHEFLQIALNMHTQLGANVILFESPPEFERNTRDYVEVMPSIILKVLDYHRIDKFGCFGLGYGGAVAFRLFMIAPMRFGGQTHCIINPRFPEGADMPERFEIVKNMKKPGFLPCQFWVVRLKKMMDQDGTPIRTQRMTAEKRKVTDKVLEDNFCALLQRVMAELRGAKKDGDPDLKKRNGEEFDEIIFTEDMHYKNLHWYRPEAGNSQCLIILCSRKLTKCLVTYFVAQRFPFQTEVIPLPRPDSPGLEDAAPKQAVADEDPDDGAPEGDKKKKKKRKAATGLRELGLVKSMTGTGFPASPSAGLSPGHSGTAGSGSGSGGLDSHNQTGMSAATGITSSASGFETGIRNEMLLGGAVDESQMLPLEDGRLVPIAQLEAAQEQGAEGAMAGGLSDRNREVSFDAGAFGDPTGAALGASMPVQKSDESFPKITETANTTTEDSLAMKPSAEPSPAGTKSKLGSTSNSLLKTTTSGFSTKNEFEIKARSAQSELRRAAGDTAKRIERTINYGLIREIDAIVNRPEELGYDCFAELPSLQKMRKQYPDMPDPSRRPVLVGKEMNPIRKLMMEQRQQEIMRKMAVGGLETEAEEKKERQRAVVYSIEQSEKNLYFLERENEEYENSLLLKKAQLEQEQLEKVKQGERRALTMSQNFVVPDKAMAATGGPGTLGRSRGLGGSMGSARFGGPSQPEQQKKMQALKELLAQPAAAPAEVIVGAETNVRQKVELKPQVALGVDSYEDENMLAEVYRSRVADEERARAKAAAELAKKKRHDRQHTTREMRLVEFMQTKREMAGVKAMYDEQTRAVRYGDAETQKMEAVLQLSKEEFENEQARILERSEKR